MGSCCSLEQSASRSPKSRSAFKKPKSQEASSGSKSPKRTAPKATPPHRFVSVIDEKLLSELPIAAKPARETPTNCSRNLSLDSNAFSSGCYELSLEPGGASPSNSLCNRMSPKNRTCVSFVHSDDVTITEDDLAVPHDAQLASPRCSTCWSQRPRNVAGVLGNSAEEGEEKP